MSEDIKLWQLACKIADKGVLGAKKLAHNLFVELPMTILPVKKEKKKKKPK